MPTYEYQCTECGFCFERFQKMSEEPITTCCRCNGAVRRLIGAGSGVIFKGKGFYATDYAGASSGSGCWARPAVNEKGKQRR